MITKKKAAKLSLFVEMIAWGSLALYSLFSYDLLNGVRFHWDRWEIFGIAVLAAGIFGIINTFNPNLVKKIIR
jgi:hypothetical protein